MPISSVTAALTLPTSFINEIKPYILSVYDTLKMDVNEVEKDQYIGLLSKDVITFTSGAPKVREFLKKHNPSSYFNLTVLLSIRDSPEKKDTRAEILTVVAFDDDSIGPNDAISFYLNVPKNELTVEFELIPFINENNTTQIYSIKDLKGKWMLLESFLQNEGRDRKLNKLEIVCGPQKERLVFKEFGELEKGWPDGNAFYLHQITAKDIRN